MLGHM